MSKTLATLFCGGAMALAFGCIGQSFSSSPRLGHDAVVWDQQPCPPPGARDGVIVNGPVADLQLLAWDQPPYPIPGPDDPQPKASEAITPVLV